ncbi:hypothetical protein F5Y06DRAFT_186084 [Hypoxylon sp. FL0890]|nr:hypothetical protein F5Y06DRAFT_186084 [Hypoxylon sp. FL0890]
MPQDLHSQKVLLEESHHPQFLHQWMSSKHSKHHGGHHSKSRKAATPTPPPLIFGPDGYNLTEGNQIPQQFFEKVIHRAYIEFLSVSTEGMTLDD